MNRIKTTIQDIKNFVSKLRRNNTEDFQDPTRYWITALFSSCIAFLIGVIFIVTDFQSQFSVNDDENISEVQPVVFREGEIKEYAELYRKKEETFNELRKNAKFVVPEAPIVVEDVSVGEGVAEPPLAEVRLAQ